METDSLSVTQSSQGSRSIAVIRRSLYHHVIQQYPNGSRRTSQHEIILLCINIQPMDAHVKTITDICVDIANSSSSGDQSFLLVFFFVQGSFLLTLPIKNH